MSRGIKIKITRMIEARERHPDEYGVAIFNGRHWVSPDCLPCPPSIAADCKFEPKKITTVIEFLPPGVMPIFTLHYKRTRLRRMRAQGVIKGL